MRRGIESATLVPGAAVVALIAILAAGCEGEESAPAPNPIGIGSPCTRDEDCKSDREVLTCGIAPDGARLCMQFCYTHYTYQGYACLDERWVSCATLPPGSHCNEGCACPAGSACSVTNDTCMPPREVGESCKGDGECRSGNCGTNGTCRVAVGQPCTPTDCDRCLVAPNSVKLCSKPCGIDSQCGTGGRCVDTVGGSYCYLSCGGSAVLDACPEGCSVYTGLDGHADGFYCACDSCHVWQSGP